METQIITPRKRAAAAQAEPPECYGRGEVRVPLRYYEGAYNWVKVSPLTCDITCSPSRQRLCLQHQRRMLRR